MVPAKAVSTSPPIDGFLFQRNVFLPHATAHPSRLGVIWRGIFLACSCEVFHKNRLPNFQGEIKMRGVMWDLLSQLFPVQKAVAHPLLEIAYIWSWLTQQFS